MKAILLAAGYATRLYPLTHDFPKPLLPVGGKPILEWLVEDVGDAVEEFIVVTNHRFFTHFSTWAKGLDYNIRVLDDGTDSNETRLGAVRDIALAATQECDYLVMAGDNVLSFSLRPFIAYSRSVGTSCVMTYEENRLSALKRTAVITVDGTGLITSYEEKPEVPRNNLAVPPFYIYRYEDIRRIPEALSQGLNPDAPGSFGVWLSARTPMHAWRMPGVRHDIGNMASYEAVRDSYRGPDSTGRTTK